MKFILLALVASAGLCADASAQSPYAGKYFGLSFSNGQVVAGVNLKVKKDGTIVGHGAYTDLVETTLSGNVDDQGHVTIVEHSHGYQYNYTATFATNGKKFTADLSTGNVFKGKKLTTTFAQAGVYHAGTDLGERGIFLVDRNGSVYGIIYDPQGNAIEVDGTADSEGFSGMSADGVSFEGHFSDKNISGEYSDGLGFEGTFAGERY